MEIKHERLRRGVEIVVAAGVLVALAPLLGLCAIAVRLSSPGPILFRQERVGRGGNVFLLFKFRTMRMHRAGTGPAVTGAGDSRITACGRFMRKWKLDELPQFVNVLRGEMAIVGPRPEVPKFVDRANPAWNEILRFRPGLTDPVTLYLRNEEAFLADAEDKEAFYRDRIQPFKINGYLDYIRAKTIPGDLRIVARTAKVIAFPKTAAQPSREEIWGVSGF